MRPLRSAFATLLLLAVSSGASIRPAASQQDSAGGNSAGPEVTPRGQRTANDIRYGEWRKLCFTAGGAKPLCRTSITGSFPTGQVAVRLDLIEREGEPTARLQLFVPVGLYLRVLVKLKVDEGRAYQVPYSWCLTNTCIAADAADPNIVTEMEVGKTLALEVVDSSLLAVTTSLPLSHFAAIHNSAPAERLNQDIDE
jgi:invasion protein IalB